MKLQIMIKIVRNLIFGKSFIDTINETKKVKVDGIVFHIKKISILSFLAGLDVMTEHYAEHRNKKPEKRLDEKQIKKIKEHFTDVFLASIVNPKFCLSSDVDKLNDHLAIDHLIDQWELSQKLYEKIMQYTYGKKKIK